MRIQLYPERKKSFTEAFISSSSGSLIILGRQNVLGVFQPGQSCVESLHLLRLWHCCLLQASMLSFDFSKAASGSGADPHRHIGLATVMLAEQRESVRFRGVNAE